MMRAVPILVTRKHSSLIITALERNDKATELLAAAAFQPRAELEGMPGITGSGATGGWHPGSRICNIDTRTPVVGTHLLHALIRP